MTETFTENSIPMAELSLQMNQQDDNQKRIEKNKRTVQSRFTRQYAKYQHWRSMIMEMWIKAKSEKWSHEKLLDYRSQWIYDQESFQSLPQWIKYQLTGVYDVLYNMTYRLDLTFCYAHPETGVITDSHTLCKDGFAAKLDTVTGEHYWKNDDGTFSHPF